jgi:hypothetical protein
LCFKVLEAATEGGGISEDLSSYEADFSEVLSSSPDNSDLPLPLGYELSGKTTSDSSFSTFFVALLGTTASFSFSRISALL